MGSDDNVKAASGCCCCVLVIVSFSLIMASLASVEPTEMALEVNDNIKLINRDQIYYEGRPLLGLGHYFLKFPRTMQTLSVDNLRCRSKDGLLVVIDSTVQWKLIPDPENLYQLHMRFKDTYARVYGKVANDRLRNVAARFSAFQFYFSRSEVGREMEREMDIALRPIGATVESFQLLNFDLPRAFQASVSETEQKRQKIQETRTQESTAIVEARTKTNVALQAADIITVEASAQAESFLLSRQAEADSLNLTLFTEREAYARLAEPLNLTAEELLAYIWLVNTEKTGSRQLTRVEIPEFFQRAASDTGGIPAINMAGGGGGGGGATTSPPAAAPATPAPTSA